MSYKETYDTLKALQNEAFSLSTQNKNLIKQISKNLNIDFVERKKCVNCYQDQLIVLLIELKKHLTPIENKECVYEVIGNKDVTIMGKRINNELITNDLAEWLIKYYPYHKKYIRLK